MPDLIELNKSPETSGKTDSKVYRRFIFWFFSAVFFVGIAAIFFRIFWLIPRSDEVITMMVTSSQSLPILFQNMQEGIDVSCLHNILVFSLNQIFGPSIISQRIFSFCFWIFSFFLLYKILKKLVGLNPELSLLAIFFIAFGRLGIFLATDGRFYSLMLFCCVFHLYIFLQILQKKQWDFKQLFLLFFVSFAGVFTTPLFIVYLVFSSAIIFILFLSKSIRNFSLPIIILLNTGSIILFYFAFLHKGIPGEILDSYTVARASGNEVSFGYFPEQFFRWFALPEVPFLPLIFSCILLLFVLIIIVILFLKERKTINDQNKIIKYFIFAGILSFFTLAAVFIYSRYISAKPWESRYFATIFFFVGSALAIVISLLKSKKYQQIITTVFLGFFLLQSFSLINAGINFKEERANFLEKINKLFVKSKETDVSPENYIFLINNTEDIRFYGQVFALFPAQSAKLKLAIPDWLQKYPNTFYLLAKNLQSSGYILEQNLTQNQLDHSVLITSGKPLLNSGNNWVRDSLNIKNYFVYSKKSTGF